MATVQVMSTAVPAQARTVRSALTAWPPPSSGLTHTRPWRSSPLAGTAFSTLPPAIPESSEESYENEHLGLDRVRGLSDTRSPSSSSIASQTGSLTASGYGSRNASGSASALALADGEASTSSITLLGSTNANGTSSSQGHLSSQTHSNRPARLSKSRGRRTPLAQDAFTPPGKVSDVSITPPQRARTVSHNQSRSESFHIHPIKPSPTIPQAYSRTSPRPRTAPEPESKALSKSRDPASNWMSSSPFGPAQTPKFSRLAMASPTVVMPLSAKEYRKQKTRESFGRGREKEAPTASNHVSFVDKALPPSQGPCGVPVVKILPPPSEDVDLAPLSSSDHSSDRRSQPQHQVDHLPCKPLPQTSMSPRPSSPKQKRPRSRPNTPPRSSPLAAHPPISPKSSTGTFFSLASTSDDNFPPQGGGVPSSKSSLTDDPNATNAVPPARPRPRPRRRKSYPDRLSNGARLSLLEAMNRLSGHSQTDTVNRLSVASHASGHTLFYDVVESEGEQGQVTGGNGNGHADGGGQRLSILHTQSLEDLSSTLDRTGIETVRPDNDVEPDAASNDGHKGRRNVRMVRISDTVEVSPPPVPRQRKLTKSRPVLARGSAPGLEPAPALGTIKVVKPQTQVQARTQERRASLLPWKSKGSMVSAGSGAISGERAASTPTKDLVHPSDPDASTPIPRTLSPIANGLAHVGPKFNPNRPAKKTPPNPPVSGPVATSRPDLQSVPSATPHKSRRYTFSFFSSSTFHRPKREKSNTAPHTVDLSLDQNTKGEKSTAKGIESGTDSTSTSIRTITQGSQSTLVPPSPVLHDLTTLASSGGLSGSEWGTKSSVPMLRRLNAQEMETAGVPLRSECDGRGDSTPSLITNGTTSTSSSALRTPSFVRGIGGGEPFVPRPSGLKESFTDTSEDDLEDVPGRGRTSRMCMHLTHEQSPLARVGAGWGDISEEDDRYLRPSADTRLGSRPGTSNSTLTAATETSGSYVSFSTVPASTVSSSSSSRSGSPSPVADDRRDQVLPVSQGEDGDVDIHPCALCGHRSTSPTRSLSPSPTREPDMEEVHPMFTVPLVTISTSTLGLYSRSSTNTPPSAALDGRNAGVGSAGYVVRRKSERHVSVHVPAAATVNVSVPHDNQNRMRVNANGGPVTMSPSTSTKPRTLEMATNDKLIITMTKMTTPSPAPVPASPKVRKQRRPQTAPAGTGDVALKFIEDAKAMRAREGNVDTQFHADGDRPTKRKGAGESRFKAVLKGLLRRSN